MVENVPFYHALAYIVINEQGYGKEALATLFFLFGLSSVFVGLVFYSLGKLELGRIVYFFPSHVLVGCIGGIGVFIIITAIEVTINTSFSFDLDSLQDLRDNFHLLGVVLIFEVVLRVLSSVLTNKDGRSKFPLLIPVYFCMITPIFYASLWLFRVNIDAAEDAGYFFPASDSCDPSVSGADCNSESAWASDLITIWSVLDLKLVSFEAVLKSIPTVVALAAFSLIHVPINIPAFAISTDVGKFTRARIRCHNLYTAHSQSIYCQIRI